jgi:hypothetical protein
MSGCGQVMAAPHFQPLILINKFNMKKLFKSCLVATAVFAASAALAADRYVQTTFLNAVPMGTNATLTYVPSIAKTVPTNQTAAAVLGYNVNYATLSVRQVSSGDERSNVVYTVSGSVNGTKWQSLATLTVALLGATETGGFTNIPASVFGGFQYLGLTSVTSPATTNSTITARLGYWHAQ